MSQTCEFKVFVENKDERVHVCWITIEKPRCEIFDQLQCEKHYRKDLEEIRSYPAFSIMCKPKHEGDTGPEEFAKFLNFLSKNNRAACFQLDSQTKGFFAPRKNEILRTANGVSIRCHYQVPQTFQPLRSNETSSTLTGNSHTSTPAPNLKRTYDQAINKNEQESNEGLKRMRFGTSDEFEKISADHSKLAKGLTDQELAMMSYSNIIRTKEDRPESYIYHLRTLNNCIKSLLIQSTENVVSSGTQINILELACGKGGDWGKWLKHPRGISKYVGVDIAKGSLIDFIDRRNRPPQVSIKLIAADIGGVSLSDKSTTFHVWEPSTQWELHSAPLNPEVDQFDIVSMQLALHYMFQSEQRARLFFSDVTRYLRSGGQFIATTVDARTMIQMLMGHAKEEYNENGDVVSLKFAIEDEKTTILTTKFAPNAWETVLQPIFNPHQSLTEDAYSKMFGIRYHFTLHDDGGEKKQQQILKNSKDSNQKNDSNIAEAVDAPEWLCPLPLLEKIGREYGLKLIEKKNFQEFIRDKLQQNRREVEDHMKKFHVLNYRGEIGKIEWQVARLYMVLRFEKI